MLDTAFTQADSVSVAAEPQKFGSVSVNPLMAVADFAVANGLATDRVENALGMTLSSAKSAAVLPGSLGPDLFRLMMDAGIGNAPAVQLAGSAPFNFFGGLERAVLLSPNGQEGLKTMAAHFAVFHDRLNAVFDQSKSYTYFSFRFPGDESDNGCCNEVVLGVLLRVMRGAFGDFGRPVETRMRYSRNGSRAVYEKYFDSRLRFNAEDQSHGFVFRTSDMQWRQPGYDSSIFELAVRRLAIEAEVRRGKTKQSDFLELVNASYQCAGIGLFSVKAVCEKSGIGERTAQRIASKHDTTIGKLVEAARLRIIKEVIAARGDISTDDLAALTGFSDSRALRRALKAWTGKTLTEFRKVPF
ncbi:MAG: AraC family transcriptional regulator ligand-binding domain-containing protein [Pseudomonadota bacterium]